MTIIVDNAASCLTLTANITNLVLNLLVPTAEDVAKFHGVKTPFVDVVGVVLPYYPKAWGGRIVTPSIQISGAFGQWQFVTLPSSFFEAETADQVESLKQPICISDEKAVELAREYIVFRGYDLERAFAEQDPIIEKPSTSGTRKIARTVVKWFDPRISGERKNHIVLIEVNSNSGRIERAELNGEQFESRYPYVRVGMDISDSECNGLRTSYGEVNRRYIFEYVEWMKKRIVDFGLNCGMDFTSFGLHQVEALVLEVSPALLSCEIRLHSGVQIRCFGREVVSVVGADSFFRSTHRVIRIREFEGKPTRSVDESIARTKEVGLKLGLGRLDGSQVELPAAWAIPTIQRVEVSVGLSVASAPRFQCEFDLTDGRIVAVARNVDGINSSPPKLIEPLFIGQDTRDRKPSRKSSIPRIRRRQ